MQDSKVMLQILILTALFSIPGCKSKESGSKTSDEIIKISLENFHSVEEISDIFDVAEYIKLESNDSCTIGELSLFKVTSDAFYILDESSTNQIFKFDKYGRFLFKIGKNGRGPGEYNDPSWFTVDEMNKRIFVLDPGKRKLLIYKTDDGTYISSIGIDFNARSFEIVPNGTGIIFYTSFLPNENYIRGNNNFNTFLTDNSGNVIKTAFPFNKEYEVTNFIGIKSIYSIYNNQLFIFSQYCDTIFEVSNYALNPKYFIDYKNNNQDLSKKYVDRIGPNKTVDWDYINDVRKNSNVYHLRSQFHTRDHIIIGGVYNRTSFTWVYDKHSGHTIDLMHYKTELLNNIAFMGNDQEFYYTVRFASGYNSAPEICKRFYSEKLNELLKISESQDNPIVLKYKFKNF